MSDWLKARYEDAKLAYKALMKFYPLTLEDLDGEEWRPIEGYDGYQISNFGRVKSFKCYAAGKILHPGLNVQGYLKIQLSKNNKTETKTIHRLVATAFISNIEAKPEVNHIYSRFNNHVDGLEWVTNCENKQHALREGLRPQGGSHKQAKLTDAQARYIRDNPDNLLLVQFAKMFGISQAVVSKIQLGRGYRNAGGESRKSKQRIRIDDKIREKIRADYQRNVLGHGYRNLAKKYGFSPSTIQKIVNEK